MEDLLRPQRAAARALRSISDDAHANSPATAVDELAYALGVTTLSFHPDTRRRGTLGWLEPGEDVVFLREGLPDPVRRFTLAHELGHFLLHRSSRKTDEAASALDLCDGDDLDTPLEALATGDELLRPGQAYSARARRESEANVFAAVLLLPAETLLRRYREASGSRRSPRSRRALLRSLAGEFGVSEDVLLRRLTGLLAGAERDREDLASVPEGAPGAGERSRASLDPWQEAASRSETPALIVAGPGTGKTSTLVARVAYLVRERGIRPENILALTFSNKAAREMSQRLQVLLASDADDTGDVSAPTVSTIHAFCGDLLRRYGPLVGIRPDFRLVSDTDGYFLLRRLADQPLLSRYQPLAAPAMHFPTLLGAISRAKDELRAPDDYASAADALVAAAQTPEEHEAAEKTREVAAVYTAYQAELSARGDADFGDMIRLAVTLLCDHPDVLAQVGAQYSQVLVDEFQDINRAMGVLLRTLAGPDGPLWAVGDADQAIYRFRGASPANLTRFTSDYPAARVHSLRRNYRSVPAVLESAAALASDFMVGDERVPLEATRTTPNGPTVTLATARDEATELAGLTAAIRSRYNHGRSLADQVVLCRTRRQCQRVARALLDAALPARIVTPLLEQDEVKDVLGVVSLLVDTSGAGLLRAGRVTDHAFTHADARIVLDEARRRGMSPRALLAAGLADVEGLSPTGREGLRRLDTLLLELRQSPDVATGLARYVFGLTTLGDALFIEHGDVEATRTRAGRFAQLLGMARAFEDAQRAQPNRRGRHSNQADWAGFVDYVRVMSVLRQDGAGSIEDAPAAEADAVRVLTVHGSKGLEFPVVYLPGLADRRFPAQRRGNLAPLPPTLLGDDEPPADLAAEHLAEEANLFYVALTRARDELILSHAERYGRQSARPSVFLRPLQRVLGERLHTIRWDVVPVPVGTDAARSQRFERLTPPADLPLRQSAIEIYRRCPRQYAYRYIYGLRPSEIGLATLRSALHDTLHTLGADVDTTHAAAPAASEDDALALFEEAWQAAVRRARRDAGDAADAESVGAEESEPFTEMYRRHGREVVRRAWTELAQEQPDEAPLAPPAARASASFDHTVTVRMGQRDIAVTLDRVERTLQREAAHGGGPRSPGAEPQPVRFVRHRLGSGGSNDPDLRTLFYSLAAEQGKGAPVEIVNHNLTTGELEPVTLDPRKLARLREQVGELLADMESGIYPPRPDPMTCQNCPFLLICPA